MKLWASEAAAAWEEPDPIRSDPDIQPLVVSRGNAALWFLEAQNITRNFLLQFQENLSSRLTSSQPEPENRVLIITRTCVVSVCSALQIKAEIWSQICPNSCCCLHYKRSGLLLWTNTPRCVHTLHTHANQDTHTHTPVAGWHSSCWRFAADLETTRLFFSTTLFKSCHLSGTWGQQAPPTAHLGEGWPEPQQSGWVGQKNDLHWNYKLQ